MPTMSLNSTCSMPPSFQSAPPSPGETHLDMSDLGAFQQASLFQSAPPSPGETHRPSMLSLRPPCWLFQSAPPSPGETHLPHRRHARPSARSSRFNPLPRRRGRPTTLEPDGLA